MRSHRQRCEFFWTGASHSFQLVVTYHLTCQLSYQQVISIDLRSNLTEGKGVYVPEGHQAKLGTIDEIAYAGILNKVLPPEIRVIAWAPVKEGFSARFDCKQRTYHYYFPKATLNIEVVFKCVIFTLLFSSRFLHSV